MCVVYVDSDGRLLCVGHGFALYFFFRFMVFGVPYFFRSLPFGAENRMHWDSELLSLA